MVKKGGIRRKCDPCGILCLLLTYAIICYTNYAFIYWIAWDSALTVGRVINAVVFQILIVLLTWSHFRASFTDPGIVTQGKDDAEFSREALLTCKFSNITQANNSSFDSGDDDTGYEEDVDTKRWTICPKCQTYRPPRAHHCSICKRCIRKMDHHCPWINNCVGERNRKYFLQFLLYVGIVSFYTIGWILFELMRNQHPQHTKALHIFILLMMSLLFGIFVIAISSDQATSISTNQSPIDRLQENSPSRAKCRKVILREICGTNNVLCWLLPCHSHSLQEDSHLVV